MSIIDFRPQKWRSDHIVSRRATWAALARIVLTGGVLWLIGFAVLSLRWNMLSLPIQGLYRQEPGPPPFRWTSNRVVVPVHGRSGPTHVVLKLRTVPEQGPQGTPVSITSDTGVTATLLVTLAIRSYELWLPTDTRTLTLQTAVRHLRPGDYRLLGVQLLTLSTTPSGFPLHEAVLALLVPLIGLPVIWGLRRLVRRGYGLVIGLTAVGLGMRLAGLSSAPPGFARDEMVSLVDAWFLVHTGRDHLSHWLPIAAFEAYGDWISPLLTYLETPLALFGMHPFVARLLTATIGTLAVPAIYSLARALDMPRVAAVGAALTAACSPWMVFLSRAAKPPALVPLAWTLCLWSALQFVRYGRRREAFWLAGAAGIAVYAYPTLKMTVPLLVGLAVVLALYGHGWSSARRWLLPALLLALVWLPFGLSTLFNSSSGSRFDQVGIHESTLARWALQVWQGYRLYFDPSFYYVTGDPDPSHGMPNRGVELSVTAPLALIGLATLAYHCVSGFARGQLDDDGTRRRAPQYAWLIAGALAIAPLPASLTLPNPHTFRGSGVAPLYALLVGYGVAGLWQGFDRIAAPTQRRGLQILAAGVFVAVLGWQSGGWLQDLIQVYAPNVGSGRFSDGLPETMERVVSRAPEYDDVWFDTASISKPYIYVLAAQALPAQEAQRTLVVKRAPSMVNNVLRIGRYHFDTLQHVPRDLPVLEALTDQFGNPAYVIQEWVHDRQRSLVVRAMVLRADE